MTSGEALSDWQVNLLRWMVSPHRWLSRVIGLGALALVFVVFAELSMGVLGIAEAPETAGLFRLYGAMGLAAAAGRHGLFPARTMHALRAGFVGDFFMATITAAVLLYAVSTGIAGPATWVPIALFVGEAIGFSVSWFSLRSASQAQAIRVWGSGRSYPAP